LIIFFICYYLLLLVISYYHRTELTVGQLVFSSVAPTELSELVLKIDSDMAITRSLRPNAHLLEADPRAKLLAPTIEPPEICSPHKFDLPQSVLRLSPTAAEFFNKSIWNYII
jgi:hypothetical protein